MRKSACLIMGLIIILLLSVSAEARMLHAAAGKFIDPLGGVPGPYLVQPTAQTNQTNLYNFVGNNPVNATDPLGLRAVMDAGSGGSYTYDEAGVTYNTNGFPVNEVGLEKNPLIDPIDFIPLGTAGGETYKLGKACIYEGAKGSRLLQVRLKDTGKVLFRLDKDGRGLHYHRWPNPKIHRPWEGW